MTALSSAQTVIRVNSVGGWPGMSPQHNTMNTISRAVADANSKGLRVVAATPDTWGFFRKLWAGLIGICTLGFKVAKPNLILICE